MVERKAVSVNWQTLFVFIPFVDLWAAYRIEKLRWYLLIFLVGFGIVQFSISAAINDTITSSIMMQNSMMNFEQDPELQELFASDMFVILIIAEIIEFAARIYFIRRWSKEWNYKIRGYFGG